jgi:signal transduction histidine kinase
MHIDTLQGAVQAILETHQPNRIELPLVRQTGTVFEADVALAPILSDEKDQTRIICSIRDVSERKRAEAELRQALAKEKELNELKSRFVSMVSHDFRTPLATILSSADLVWHYADRMTDDRKRQHFATIQGQVKYLTNLLEDVLTINRAESGSLPFNPETTNLEIFCKTVVEEMQLLAGSRTVHFTASRSTDLPIDTKLMRQALVNLLSNAIKYSPDDSQIDVGLCCRNKKAVLAIKDRGIGIPEADQAHLFEVFHRASNVGTIRGTGLGMVIVKQAVEAHGGTIAVKSQVGVGTTVVIEIPIKEQAK